MRALFVFALSTLVYAAAIDATPTAAEPRCRMGKAMPVAEFQEGLHLCEGLPVKRMKQLEQVLRSRACKTHQRHSSHGICG